MDHSLYVAMTGAKQIMQAQAVNAHNMANVSTIGFRADTHQFQSFPIYGAGYPTRVNAVATDGGADLSTGVLSSTGRDLDIAVNGKGFIAVQGADGKEAYTRAGDLQITANGVLQTASGYPVMSDGSVISLPPASQVTIGGDGTISVVPLGLSPAALAQGDRIKLVNPAEKDLVKGTDGLFRLKTGAKAPSDTSVTISSGVLESSNVNMAQSLINMIELQRLYEMQIKGISTADQNSQSSERLMQ
jgi:flagellar basal-body rod protein FlgF